MSNTEQMLSAPRKLLERVTTNLGTHGVKYDESAIRELRQLLLAPPAAQHQGEPVAWVIDTPEGRGADYYCGKGLDRLEPGTKLYTNADSAEVERLREGIAKHWKVVCDQRAELDTLRVRWSEARTLLLELEGDHTLMLQMGASEFGQKECKTLRARLLKLRTYLRTNTEPMANTLAALSASAEPSAPKCEHNNLTYRFGDPAVHCSDCGCVTGYPIGSPVERDEQAAIQEALLWLDDFVARCNGDDRGSCSAVETLRAYVAHTSVGQTATTAYRLIQAGEKILATDQFLGDDAATWRTVTECPVFIGMAYHQGWQPVRRAAPGASNGGAE